MKDDDLPLDLSAESLAEDDHLVSRMEYLFSNLSEVVLLLKRNSDRRKKLARRRLRLLASGSDMGSECEIESVEEKSIGGKN